jgi:hypothetical protein
MLQTTNLKIMLEVEITIKRTTMRLRRSIRTLLSSIHANLRLRTKMRPQNSQDYETSRNLLKSKKSCVASASSRPDTK